MTDRDGPPRFTDRPGIAFNCRMSARLRTCRSTIPARFPAHGEFITSSAREPQTRTLAGLLGKSLPQSSGFLPYAIRL